MLIPHSRVLPEDAIAPIEEEDADVGEERDRVLGGGAGSDLIKLTNITKIYQTRGRDKHLAVHKLCLGVPKGEVILISFLLKWHFMKSL